MAPINPAYWDIDDDEIWNTGIDDERYERHLLSMHKRNAAQPGEFMHTRAVSGESNTLRIHTTAKARLEKKFKKHKLYFRRFIMAGKGIGIGGLIFWGFLGYQIFFSSSDDTDKPEGTAEKKDFSTKVVETAKKLKTEVEVRVAKVKEDYNRDQDAVPDAVPDAEEVDKKIDDPDDIYGSTEDKY